jgi:Pyruvate/2-oxoacid:ferredoxin oxidoreductase delta subunit
MATMGCRSATNVEEASTAVVVRMDYTQLNPDMENKWVYYQLHNTTDDRVVKLKTLDGERNIISAYYAENPDKVSEAFGSVQIPGRGYEPLETERVPQLEAHLHTLVDNGTRHSKCYVRDASNTKWYLYIIHVIPNTQQYVVGDDADIYLEKDKDYLLVIANDPVELAKPLCSSTTPIRPTTDTYVELRDTEGSIERVECKDELCANNIYFLNVRVENTFASGIGGGLETMGAQVHADWLFGEATDDAYCHARTMTEDERKKIDTIRELLGTNFCRRCNYCAPCTANINISSIFLLEGYYSRYNLKDWAMARYSKLEKTASDCIGCGVCETRCPYNLPIREMLKKASLIMGK